MVGLKIIKMKEGISIPKSKDIYIHRNLSLILGVTNIATTKQTMSKKKKEKSTFKSSHD